MKCQLFEKKRKPQVKLITKKEENANMQSNKEKHVTQKYFVRREHQSHNEETAHNSLSQW